MIIVNLLTNLDGEQCLNLYHAVIEIADSLRVEMGDHNTGNNAADRGARLLDRPNGNGQDLASSQTTTSAHLCGDI